jgi:hypothetical protein
MITLALFIELISHDMFLSETQRFHFQILHLTNPHDKLSTFMFYPSLGFPSIYRLTIWDLRLGHLSLLSYVGRRIWDGEHEL